MRVPVTGSCTTIDRAFVCVVLLRRAAQSADPLPWATPLGFGSSEPSGSSELDSQSSFGGVVVPPSMF